MIPTFYDRDGAKCSHISEQDVVCDQLGVP